MLMLYGDPIILEIVTGWRECKEEPLNVFRICPCSLEYDECLVTLKLPTLSYRRHCADMIMVYNILQGNINLQPELFFHLNLSSATRGHDFKLFKPHAQKNVQSKFFSVRTINSWNNLPNYVVSSNSTDNFKILIDNFYS